MKSTLPAALLTSAFVALGCSMACGGGNQSAVAPSPNSSALTTDAALFKLVTQTDPFGSYSLFPNADAVANGSAAHLPRVRVSMNAKALAALQNGKLPPGTRFPDGSVVFKEVLTNGGTTTTYSVMYKDAANPQAGNGWLWAEFSPSGSVGYPINNRGAVCTACHSLGQGPTNDYVRTFERQRSVVEPSPNTSGIVTDSELFRLVTQTDPFGSYSLFPNADAVFNGSTAHRPLDRVSMNAKAFAALQSGKLPPGTKFPDGSVVFKEILTNGGTTTTYSVMYKDAANPQAGNGWLWAEFSPSGVVGFSISNRGVGCTECHSLGQGRTNDLVRTFERQHSS